MNSTECVRSIRCASSSIQPSIHWTYAPLNPCLLLCCYWGRSKICISSRESPFIDIKKWTRPLLPMLHNTQSSFSSTVSIHPSLIQTATTAVQSVYRAESHQSIWYNFMVIQGIVPPTNNLPGIHLVLQTDQPPYHQSDGACDSECTQVVIKYSYVWPISIQGLMLRLSPPLLCRCLVPLPGESLVGCSQMEMCTIPKSQSTMDPLSALCSY